MGLVVHPRDHDLVIGTHGRAAYILDDVRPLRTLSPDLLAKPLHFFEVPDAQAYTTRQKEGSRFVGDGEFRGENEPYGALLTYSLNLPGLPHPAEEKERERKQKDREATQKPLVTEAGIPQSVLDIPKEPEAGKMKDDAKAAEKPGDEPDTGKPPEVDIEVSDAAGTVIRKFKGPARLGVNRASWDLHRDAFKRAPVPGQEENEFRPRTGPEILPGTYTVTIRFRGNEAKQSVRVLADPRDRSTPEQRSAKFDAIMRAGKLSESVAVAIERIQKTRADIDSVSAKLKKSEDAADKTPDPLVKSGAELKKRLDEMEKRLWTPPKTKGIVAETDALSKITYPLYSLQSSTDAPTAAQLAYLQRGEALLRAVVTDYNKLFAEDVARYREAVRKSSVNLLPEEDPLTVP
jgi:hypothetical protein